MMSSHIYVALSSFHTAFPHTKSFNRILFALGEPGGEGSCRPGWLPAHGDCPRDPVQLRATKSLPLPAPAKVGRSGKVPAPGPEGGRGRKLAEGGQM